MIIHLNDTNAWQLICETATMAHGVGLFETILLVRGKPIFLREHLDRLNHSLSFLGVEGEITLDALQTGLLAIDSNISHQVLKIIVYCHMKNGYMQIIVSPDVYSEHKIACGMRIRLTQSIQPTTNPLNVHKTTNYLERRLLMQLLQKEGFDEGVRINEFGRISEGTKTNVFIFNGTHWVTPPLTEGLLGGISRQWLIQSFRSKDIEIMEEPITVADFEQAPLIVLTNSLIGCTHVNRDHPKPSQQLELINSLSQGYRGGFYGCT